MYKQGQYCAPPPILIPMRLFASFFKLTVPGTVGIPLYKRKKYLLVIVQTLIMLKNIYIKGNSQLVFLQFIIHVCEHFEKGLYHVKRLCGMVKKTEQDKRREMLPEKSSIDAPVIIVELLHRQLLLCKLSIIIAVHVTLLHFSHCIITKHYCQNN